MTELQKIYVESGTFRISKSRRARLEASLGTCVGLAIVDRRAAVGGLYHILLPEHVSPYAPQAEDIYANTGMPRFLQLLREAGCRIADMEATLAGGALFGRVSEMDLDLDFGGRTLEVVHRMLVAEGIREVRSETGGYLGSQLRLNLHTLECEIEPAYPLGAVAVADVSKPTPEELDRAAARIEPIPQVALKIIRTVQSEDFSLKDIAREIRHDQVISANVIKLCNTAYVSPKEEVRSIDQAMVLLGSRMVVRLVLSSALGRFFRPRSRGYAMSKGGLYHHAVSTAIVSEQLSRMTGRAQPDIAYTAGLMHDIGKVLLDQFVAPSRPSFYRRVCNEGDELLDVEKSLLGINHIEAGMRLAELWAFPPSLRDVIAGHGQPERARHDPSLVHVVYLADLLVTQFNSGYELERIGTRGMAGRLRQLGLDQDSLAGIIARVRWDALSIPGYF